MKINKIIVALFLVIILSNFVIAREYDPTVGRFQQRDPIGEVDGVNLYTYVKNNPVNNTDPYGLLTVNFQSFYVHSESKGLSDIKGSGLTTTKPKLAVLELNENAGHHGSLWNVDDVEVEVNINMFVVADIGVKNVKKVVTHEWNHVLSAIYYLHIFESFEDEAKELRAPSEATLDLMVKNRYRTAENNYISLFDSATEWLHKKKNNVTKSWLTGNFKAGASPGKMHNYLMQNGGKRNRDEEEKAWTEVIRRAEIEGQGVQPTR